MLSFYSFQFCIAEDYENENNLICLSLSIAKHALKLKQYFLNIFKSYALQQLMLSKHLGQQLAFNSILLLICILKNYCICQNYYCLFILILNGSVMFTIPCIFVPLIQKKLNWGSVSPNDVDIINTERPLVKKNKDGFERLVSKTRGLFLMFQQVIR